MHVFVRIVRILARRWNHSAITKEDVNWNKKSHIKMLKMALFDCAINEKCCSVDGGRNWLMHYSNIRLCSSFGRYIAWIVSSFECSCPKNQKLLQMAKVAKRLLQVPNVAKKLPTNLWLGLILILLNKNALSSVESRLLGAHGAWR